MKFDLISESKSGFARIILGNSNKLLDEFSENSIDSCVTDPPYGIKILDKEWDRIVPQRPLWEKCYRVLKPGSFLLAFSYPNLYHRVAIEIENAGFNIVDQIIWIYADGRPRGAYYELDGERSHSGLKICHEPIVMAQKPVSEKNILENLHKWGTGTLQVDDCRVKVDVENDPNIRLNAENHVGHQDRRKVVPWTYSRKYVPSTILHQGRFPGNVILDGSQQVFDMFPHTSSGTIMPHYVAKSNKSEKMSGEIGERTGRYSPGDSGSAARYFYCAKPRENERNYCRDPAATVYNDHVTVKPVSLMRYLCKLVTPKKGIILDPFMGSGTTGIGARDENRSFIGLENDRHSFFISNKRIMPLRSKSKCSPTKKRIIDHAINDGLFYHEPKITVDNMPAV